MTEDPISHLAYLKAKGIPCALATVATTSGSTPRKAGAKMVIAPSGTSRVGTIGGGKLEALVIKEALELLSAGIREPVLRTYPLHEADENAFGAICGGEITVLTETFPNSGNLVIVGAGHCGIAIAKLAIEIGIPVALVDDRPDMLQAVSLDPILRALSLDELEVFSKDSTSAHFPPLLGFIAVSRNHETDLDALRKVLPVIKKVAYVGMMGSKRKVRRVMETLADEGFTECELKRVHAPIGMDIGAESPGEIAVSILAQLLAVTRGKPGSHMSESANSDAAAITP